MRIVGGIHSSRRLTAPDGKETRPTLDKVREAVFSSLGGFFDGGVVLDLYAGSAAVGETPLHLTRGEYAICEQLLPKIDGLD